MCPVHAVKTYSGRRRTVLITLNLRTRWRGMVNITPRPLYPREIDPVPTEDEPAWIPELVWPFRRREKSVVPAGIQNAVRPTRVRYSGLNELLPQLMSKGFERDDKLEIAFLQPNCVIVLGSQYKSLVSV
jgi:hypothetical protein